MLAPLLFGALLLGTCSARRQVNEYEIDLDLPPQQRWEKVIHGSSAGGIRFNDTVWGFYNQYFAKDPILTGALYGLTDLRGKEVTELQGEVEGLAAASGLPVKFVQGIQMLYELQTLMVPIVNCSDYPVPVAAGRRAMHTPFSILR